MAFSVVSARYIHAGRAVCLLPPPFPHHSDSQLTGTGQALRALGLWGGWMLQPALGDDRMTKEAAGFLGLLGAKLESARGKGFWTGL